MSVPARVRMVSLVLIAAALVLTGCAEQVGTPASDVKYSEYGVTEYRHPTRVVTFTGVDSSGSVVRSRALDGHVLVVNFWYAGCPPCIAEAADLAAVSKQYASRGVRFVGVNTSDSSADVARFAEQHHVGYPNLVDVSRGAVRLAFSGVVPLNATPETVVMTADHRAIAVLSGRVDASTLSSLIDRALA